MQRFGDFLRSILRDIFSEEESTPDKQAEPARWIQETRARLNELTPGLAQMEEDEKHARQMEQRFLTQAAQIESQAKEALKKGDELQVRDLTDEVWQWRGLAEEWLHRAEEINEIRQQMQLEIKRLHSTIDEAALRAYSLETSRRSAQALADLEQIRREAEAESKKASQTLDRRAREVYRLQDRLDRNERNE